MNSRAGEEGRWDFEAERLGVFEIYMQQVLRGLVYRQVGRLRSAHSFVAIGGACPNITEIVVFVGVKR